MKKHKLHAIRINKCLHCNQTTRYTVRDHDINSNLTDSDLLQMQYKQAEDPYRAEYCEECDMTTLQLIVAWDMESRRSKELGE